MTSFKKVLSMLLALIMILTMAPVALAESGVEFTVGSPDAAIAAGDSFTVPVSITRNTGVAAIEFYMDYDPEVFTLQEMNTTGVTNFTGTVISNPENGYHMWTATAATTATGAIVNCVFTVNEEVEDGDYEISIKDVYMMDENFDDLYGCEIANGTVTVSSYAGLPFAGITYFDEEGNEVSAPIREDGEYSYADGWAVVPKYVIMLPYEYSDVCYLYFNEETSFQYTYADEGGNQTYWDYDTYTLDCAEINFAQGDYFLPQVGEGWDVAPEFAITWEIDPDTIPIPPWEPTPDDIIFHGGNTSQKVNELENGVFQVDTPSHAFKMEYSVMNMPVEYEVKDFEWKYTDARGVVQTDTDGHSVIFADLSWQNFGMGTVQLTINFWPLTHNEDEIITVVKTAPFYFGSISTAVSQAEAEMKIGETLELTATHTISDVTFTWDSSDKNVATVVDGIVTAVGSGTADITVTANGKTATCAVTVAAPVSLSDCKIVARSHVKDANGDYAKDENGEFIYEYTEIKESIVLRNNGYVDGSPWKNSAYMFVMDKDGNILTDVEWALADTSNIHQDVNNNPGPGGFIVNTSCNKIASTTLTATLSDGSEISVQVRAINYAGKISYDSSMASYYYVSNENRRMVVAAPGDTMTPAYSLMTGSTTLSAEDAATNTVEWRSTDESVAKFENGMYTFGEGTAEIYGVIVGSVDGKRTELEGERIKVFVGSEYPQNAELVYEDGTVVPKTYTTSTDANAYKYARTTVAVGGKTVVKLIGVPETSTANVVVKSVSSNDTAKVTASNSGNTITLTGVEKTGGESPVKVSVSWTKKVGEISQNMGMTFYVDVYECAHTDATEDVTKTPNGDETHTITTTVTCKCGYTNTVTETAGCVDAENDGLCDTCGGEVACKHVNTTPGTATVSNGDKTHTVTITVTCECGHVVSTTSETVPCTDTEEPIGQCDVCGGNVIIGLTAFLSEDKTVIVGDAAEVKLFVDSDNAEETYNAFKFVVTYDADVLEFVETDLEEGTNYSYHVDSATAGELVIDGYGPNKTVSDTNALVTVTFKGKAAGNGEVTITEAKANDRATAAELDLQVIDKGDATAVITVEKLEYTVTFNTTVNGGETELRTEDGKVTFNLDNNTNVKNVTATNGTVTKNEDGSYTVTGVTENTTVTVTYKEYFDVAVSGNAEGEFVGTIGEDVVLEGESYTFTVNALDGYKNYTATVTMGDQTVEFGTGTHTIQNVTANITITINKEKDEPATPITYNVYTVINDGEKQQVGTVTSAMTTYNFNAIDGNVVVGVTGGNYVDNLDGTFTVTTVGDGFSGDIVITYASLLPVTKPENVTGEDNAVWGQEYTFTVTNGKIPIVKVGDQDISADVIDNGDGTYTIPAANVTDVITIELPVAITVAVKPYFDFNDGTMMLVVATTDEALSAGKVLAYNNEIMYLSAKYGTANLPAYAWLVPVVEGDETLTDETAAANVAIADGTAVEIDYSGDVNMTGNNDQNDAQLVYDLYNAQYSDFTPAVTMEEMLRADVADDASSMYKVDTADAIAIVTYVRNND